MKIRVSVEGVKYRIGVHSTSLFVGIDLIRMKNCLINNRGKEARQDNSKNGCVHFEIITIKNKTMFILH